MWSCKESRQKHMQYAVVVISAVSLAIIIQRHAKPKAQTTTNNKLYSEGKKSCNQVLDRIGCCQEIKQFRKVDEFDEK